MPRVSFEPRYQVLREKLKFYATANHDSTLVARGSKITKTTKQVAAGERTRIKAKVKHLKRLREKRTAPRAKVRFAATDEFGQTATAVLKFALCRNRLSGVRCR
jgi:hypothetical protein